MDITLGSLMDGGLEESVAIELKKVIINILDPNTSSKKSREINIKIKLTPWENRKNCNVSTEVKSKLQPAAPLETMFIIGEGSNGVEAVEVGDGNPYQRIINTETGEIIDDQKLERVAQFNQNVKVIGQ